MKKLAKGILATAVAACFLSSCVVYQTHTVTGAPIGTKVGVSKGGNDHTLKTAMKNGGITKVGSVDEKLTMFIIPFYKTTVTGE